VDVPELIERFRQKFIPSGTVVEHAVTSGVWEGSLNSLNRLVQLTKVAILAQLLPPKEFGLLGIGFLTLAVFESFSQFGINKALIQQKERNVDRYLDTAWVLQILRGALLFGLIFFIAPYAAAWFGEPRATNVIRALGIGPLLLGLKNPGAVYFKKNLQFHLRFAQIMSGTLINFVVAVALGVILGNVWALVAGAVVGNVASFLVSYRLHEYRPGFEFSPELARELIDFGKWVFGSSIAGFLQGQGDDIFVGWFFGATPLAFYQMAYRFSNAPATELSDVINSVTFPTLSQVQENYEKLRNGYFRSLRFSTFLAFPASFGIVLVAPAFVRVVLGQEWLPTVPIMQALAIWGMLRALDSTNFSVMYALSHPDLVLKLKSLRVLLIGAGIYFGADRFGLVGVTMVLIVAGVIVAPIGIYLTLQLMDASARRCVRILAYPFLGSVIMAGVLFYVRDMVPFPTPLLELASLIFLGALVYSVCVFLATRFLGYGVEEDIKAVMKSFS
jgi:O-antigen/teichoic acid export membrane protein